MGIPKTKTQNHDYGRINHGKEDIGKYFSQNNYRGLKGDEQYFHGTHSFHG
jgi:hypothetical protein